MADDYSDDFQRFSERIPPRYDSYGEIYGYMADEFGFFSDRALDIFAQGISDLRSGGKRESAPDPPGGDINFDPDGGGWY